MAIERRNKERVMVETYGRQCYEDGRKAGQAQLTAVTQRAERLERAMRAMLEDVIGAPHDPLWIIRRELIEDARQALAAEGGQRS